MIRINLLPVREARRQANVRQQGVMLVVALVFAVVICGGVQLWKQAEVSRKRQEIAAAQIELNDLKKVREKVAEYTKEKQEIERKLAVIANLESSRSGPVRLMDEIASRIPKRVWLTSLTMKGGVLNMEGVSLDAEIVAAFLTSLEESPLIDNVELEETLLSEKEGLKLTTFKVRSAYPFRIEIPQEIKEARVH